MKYVWMSLLLPLLAGCGVFSNAPATVLNEKNNGETIVAAVGEEIAIVLAANPTTGYQWELFNPSTNASGAPVLKLESKEFTPPSGNLVGAPGEIRFQLKALAPGEAIVSCYYFRPWEELDPATDAKMEYRIEVK